MNILVLSSVYKDFSNKNYDTSTNIVNSFAYSWVKQGHNVVVVHNSHCYPVLVHLLPRKIRKRLESKLGFWIADWNVICKKNYNDNGVEVVRLPIKKFVPHSSPSKNCIERQYKKILYELKKMGFIPDVITGHWASPQMEIIPKLKDKFGSKTAVVLHGNDYIDDANFMKRVEIDKIDKIGGRSYFQSLQLKDILKANTLPFVCNSGVPDEYVAQYANIKKSFDNVEKWNIAYVGRLVKYKNIDASIKALSQLNNVEWEFNIVGDGAERSNLEHLAKELNCADKVRFLGKIPRSEVMKVLADTHVFIMISTAEVFGLVYLEAMAAGCLTIASKRGGVDGIIVNGENGYLCEEGNAEELNRILTDITDDSPEKLFAVSLRAQDDVKNHTDTKAAERYLSEIVAD